MVDAFTLADRVDDLSDDIGDNLSDDVPDAMDDTASEVRRNIRDNESIATGQMHAEARAERTTPDRSNGIAATEISLPWWYNYPEYGTGARGGSTPWPDDESYPSPSPIADGESIQQWIDAKGVESTHGYDEERKDDGSPSPLAWAIATTIGEIGTRPHPFMRPAWYGSSRGRQHVVQSAESAINRALRRF